jgi:hypothetical protein
MTFEALSDDLATAKTLRLAVVEQSALPGDKTERPEDERARQDFATRHRSAEVSSNNRPSTSRKAALGTFSQLLTRFVSPMTLELPGESPREGEGAQEYFRAEMKSSRRAAPQHPRLGRIKCLID